MERKKNRPDMKRLTTLILLLAITLLARPQEPTTYREKLYDSYVRGQMQEWEQIITDMELDYEKSERLELLYELCFAYYGYIGYLLSEEEDKAAKHALDKAIKKTKLLEKSLGDRPDVLAMQGALLGYRIVLSKFTSMFLGPKAMKYIKKAYESGENCFNCNTEMGNMKFYTPKFLGGSKTEAIPYYEQAVSILESSSLKTDRDWIYINVVLQLANAYKETGQLDRACELWEAMLEYEPKAEWIRKDLYVKCK
jgi:tetratricopeptide (TPR) repeat protein